MDKNKAFTLIELAIVVAIVAVVSSITLARYNDYADQLKLKDNARNFVNIIELAKKKAINSDNLDIKSGVNCSTFYGYRVNLTADGYSLILCCSSDCSDSPQSTYTFDNNITATVGAGNFDFPPLANNVNITTNTVTLKNSVIGKCVDVSISNIGITNIGDTLRSC